MSIHKSLVTAGNLRRHRNVLTRAERLELLKKEERWKEGQSIFNLPKVRNILVRAKKKKEEAAAEGVAAPGAVPAAGAAAPAAGAAPAGAKGAAAAPAKGAAPAAAGKAAAAPPKKEEKKK
jgi:small basic protein (TIGR04137 family)